MAIIRYNGTIMTKTKYNEIKQAETLAPKPKPKLSLMEKSNLFFFGDTEIALSDWLWFYGSIILMLVICFGTLLITM